MRRAAQSLLLQISSRVDGATTYGLRNFATSIPRLDAFSAHTQCQCLAFRPDGKVLAAGSDHGEIKCWNCETWEQIPWHFKVDQSILALAFSPGGKQLVLGGDGGFLSLWDVDPEDTSESTAIAFLHP